MSYTLFLTITSFRPDSAHARATSSRVRPDDIDDAEESGAGDDAEPPPNLAEVREDIAEGSGTNRCESERARTALSVAGTTAQAAADDGGELFRVAGSAISISRGGILQRRVWGGGGGGLISWCVVRVGSRLGKLKNWRRKKKCSIVETQQETQ